MKATIIVILALLAFIFASLLFKDKTALDDYEKTMKSREQMILKAKEAKKEMELKIIKYKMEKDKKIESQKKQRAMSNE